MFALALVTLFSAIYSADQQSKANRLNRRAAEKEQAAADLRNLAERRRAIAQSRRVIAEQQAMAAATGVSESSGAAGGIAAVQTGTAVNVGLQQTLADLSNQRNRFLSAAQTRMTNAQIGQQVGQAAGSFGGYSEIGSWSNG